MVIPIALFSALFFLCGAAFAYMVVFPYAFQFFMSYARDIIRPSSRWRVLTFTLKLLVAFGIAFELPLFEFFPGRWAWSRPAACQVPAVRHPHIFIVAPFSPPDVSPVAMAPPVPALRAVHLVAHFFSTRKEADEAAPAPAAAAAADEEKTGEKAASGKL